MIKCVEMMDLFLGVPSVILDDSPASINRRSLYGKAGAMRPKPYGFEYRVLSNFWIFKKELRQWVFQNTAIAVEQEDHPINPTISHQIQECINTGNKDLARELIKKCSINMPKTTIPSSNALSEEEERLKRVLARQRKIFDQYISMSPAFSFNNASLDEFNTGTESNA